MAVPHRTVAGGEDVGVGGHVGVGELRPTPHTCLNDAARRHWVEVPNPRDTFGEVGVELLEESPSHPRPEGALGLPPAGERRILGLLLTARGVEKELKILCEDFFVAAAPRLHHLVPPYLTIPCLHKPSKQNVAVPINKVEGRLRGANPVGGGVRAARHPMRGIGKGLGAEGGFTQNEGGGA